MCNGKICGYNFELIKNNGKLKHPKIQDLIKLCQFYPQGSLENPHYVFIGGSAVQILLDKIFKYRVDIDIFSFKSAYYPSFYGFFDGSRIRCWESAINIHSKCVSVNIISQINYDTPWIPTFEDIFPRSFGGKVLLTLKPEFSVISKLLSPFPRRPKDLEDVYHLCKSQNLDEIYIKSLLCRTGFDKWIRANDIKRIRQLKDVEEVLTRVWEKLVKAGLYWQTIPVELLTSAECFILIDVIQDRNLFILNNDREKIVNELFANIPISMKKNIRVRTKCRLALHFLIAELPDLLIQRFQKNSEINYLSKYIEVLLRSELNILETKRIFMFWKMFNKIIDSLNISHNNLLMLHKKFLTTSLSICSRWDILASLSILCQSLKNEGIQEPELIIRREINSILSREIGCTHEQELI